MGSDLDPMRLVRQLVWPSWESGKPRKGTLTMEELFRQFQAHESRERETLEEYRDAITRTKNPMVTFLLDMIQRDEARHDEMLDVMISTFEKGLFWAHPSGALDVSWDVSAEKDQLLALVKKFIRLEREGIREYKRLISDAKDIYKGLFSLLLHALIKDSEKHIMVLEFLQNYLKRHPD